MSWIEELYFIAPWGGKVRLIDLLREEDEITFIGKRLDVGDEDIPDDEV